MLNRMKDIPCIDCAVIKPPHLMVYDHGYNERLFSISQHAYHPWVMVLAEIAKCELVCDVHYRFRRKVREQINEWIRTSKDFDGYFDFDRALADPAQPTQMRAEFDSGDHVHPSDGGERALSDAVNLSLFD